MRVTGERDSTGREYSPPRQVIIFCEGDHWPCCAVGDTDVVAVKSALSWKCNMELWEVSYGVVGSVIWSSGKCNME